MNIDLLVGKSGQSGLLCSKPLKGEPVGAIFDALMRDITIEYPHGANALTLNIQVEERFIKKLLTDHSLFIGCVQDDLYVDALEIPLVYLNDPYGMPMGSRSAIKTHRNVSGFERFLRNSSFAQPIHRDDLSDESTLSGILGGEDVRSLKFSPALARQRDLEHMPQYTPAPAMNLGLGGGVARPRTKDGGDITDNR